jgi:ketosteroid isomerase-like protein
MKNTLPRRLALLALALAFAFTCTFARAADDKLIAAVRAADDARVAATKAADIKRLAAIYSDALHYAHSNGKVDTKATQLAGIAQSANHYEKIDYKERTFVPAGPGVVLMKGRAIFTMQPKSGAAKIINDLNYLAVWREEGGAWRFLAWQSNKNPPAGAAAK